ncbi:MAG: hypothetical protein J3R72DRAFT_527486 [Linnemannia gamsii]|nr:MAG: hypothetical protein J3R72DRAFT_527486 [Linnemannia gamsii]
MHFRNLPFFAIVATASILATVGLSLATALYTVDFELCYNSQTTAGSPSVTSSVTNPNFCEAGLSATKTFIVRLPWSNAFEATDEWVPLTRRGLTFVSRVLV